MPQWQVSLSLSMGYYHWPLNEEFRWSSTSDHLFTPDGLYLDILEIIDINDDFARTC